MRQKAYNKLKHSCSKTLTVITGLLGALVILGVPLYAGFGCLFLTIGVLDYNVYRGMIYTLIMTGASATVMTIWFYKSRYDMERR